jgi:hypothetical protein
MVLIRIGEEGKLKKIGNIDQKGGQMLYYEDSVWSMQRDANLRAEQLKDAGYFIIIDTKNYTNSPTEYIVWSSRSKRRSTRYSKKRAKRETHKEMVEGNNKETGFAKRTKYSYLEKKE